MGYLLNSKKQSDDKIFGRHNGISNHTLFVYITGKLLVGMLDGIVFKGGSTKMYLSLK